MKRTVRVYGENPAGKHFDFGSAQLAIEGVDLAIDVADANIVHIDESQLADARAGERLYRPGANSAETYDADVGIAQSSQAGASEEPGDSAESPLVRVHSPILIANLSGFATPFGNDNLRFTIDGTRLQIRGLSSTGLKSVLGIIYLTNPRLLA